MLSEKKQKNIKNDMNNIRSFITSVIMLIFISACSSDNDINEQSPQYLFFKPTLEWGSTKAQISSKMTDCSVLLDTNNELYFHSDEQIIAYSLKNDKLNTVVVIPSKTISLDEILQAFRGYKRLSQYDDLVFLDERSNTIAEIENSNGFYTISWSQYGLEMANAVDLGLSVKWSDVNLNIGYEDCAALSPENNLADRADHLNELFGWGDPTGEKRSKSWFDYPEINSISGTIYDIAKAKWGGKWRIATLSEFNELITACIWTWEEYNGKYGYKVTGPNGNHIFLTLTGYRQGESWLDSGAGFYWTGTIISTVGFTNPYALTFDKDKKGLNITVDGGLAYPYRYHGCAIRPVQDK